MKDEMPSIEDYYKARIKHPEWFPKSPPPMERTSKTSFGHYPCKKCNMIFKHPYELGAHMNQHRAMERRIMFGMSRLLKILPDEALKDYKMLRVQHYGTSTRIPSSSFIPPEWEVIAVHKPVKQGCGVWVFIEPIEVKELEKPTKSPVYDKTELR